MIANVVRLWTKRPSRCMPIGHPIWGGRLCGLCGRGPEEKGENVRLGGRGARMACSCLIRSCCQITI